jgi:colanic acid biosynthesis glycosyl transferase WcaI
MSGRHLRVKVVGLNYAPEQTGIAPYTSGLASGLQARGHHVEVLTTHPHYPQWRVRDGYHGWTRREVLDGVAVTRVRHYVPVTPTGLRRAASEITFGLRAVASRLDKADAVVFVSPALLSSALTVARVSRGRAGPAAGLIIQDLYSAGAAETTGKQGALVSGLTALEAWTARNVDGVAVIHDRFKARVVGALGVPDDRVAVVRNWTHVAPLGEFDRARMRRDLGWEGSHVVLHAGAMGEKQALGNVVEAAREAERRGSKILFVLQGDGGQRARLEKQAAGLTRIRFVDPLPGALYGQAMRAADVLLVNEKPGVVEMAVPSKLTSYFSTGVPVLAATSPMSTTAGELSDSGAGVRTDPGDPVGLVDAIDRLCADHTRAQSIGARGPDYCARVLSEQAAIDGYEAWIYELVERAARRRGER